MASAVRELLLIGIIHALLTLTTVSTQCCDMSSTSTCGWNYILESWQFSPAAVPSLPGSSNEYANFIATHPDSSYVWLQNEGGTLTSINTFSITPGTIVSFDYYYQTIDPLPEDYLHVNIKSGVSSYPIAKITTTGDAWKHYDVTCDYSNDYCCGAASGCSGTIEIISSFNAVPNTGLVAIDNIGTCGDTTTTPVPPYTLPPPLPPTSGCCNFETDVCGFSVDYPYWYWSRTASNPRIPSYDGYYYLWTNEPFAIIQTSVKYIDSLFHTYSLNYYLNTARISVSFHETSPLPSVTPLPDLVPTSYSYSSWYHAEFSLGTTCSSYPCYGYLTFQPVSTTGGPFEVAIDDVDSDGLCHDSIPCCYFDEPFICDFTSTTSDIAFNWQWSGFAPPKTPIIPPPSGTSFVYFEIKTNSVATETVASLESDYITISASTVFVGKFFAQTPVGYTGVESLQLNFVDNLTKTVTTMESVRDTSGSWMTATFNCQSIHGDCCQGEPYCTGKVLFTATVQNLGDPLIYAIDSFGIAGGLCPIPE